MPAVELEPADLQVFDPELSTEKCAELISDGMAMASQVAPCILDNDFAYPDAAKAIIRAACLRWGSSGSGVSSVQDSSGPFSQTTTYSSGARRSLFYPSEITALERLCRGPRRPGAFAIDTAPSVSTACSEPTCSFIYGSLGSPCSTCGRLYRFQGVPPA